jgi:hypothetical protein
MSFTVDLTGYNASIKRLYEMGEVRRRDIADIFRKADKGVLSMAKATVRVSKKGAYSKEYASRTHPKGYLRKSIKFKVSRKFKMVYYVNPGAWYAMIYTRGHGRFMGNPFIERAVLIRGSQAERLVRKGLDELIQRVK